MISPRSCSNEFSSYLPTPEDTWRCADGLWHAAGLAGSDPTRWYLQRHARGWLEEPAAGASMHPAELRRHLPKKDGIGTSNALPDPSGCLAPGSALC